MGLFSSLFSRSNPDPASPAEAEGVDSVAQARTRARQRLMGAVVLVGIGIIGFPLLFETQPRPIAVDVPIEIPRKDNAPPLTLPTARAPTVKAPVVPPTEPVPAPVSKPDTAEKTADQPADKAAPAMITETAAEAGLTAASKPAAAKPSTPVVPPKVVAKVEDKPEPRPEPRPEPKLPPKATDSGESARAQALLDGKAAAAAPASAQRFIVQVGAFADPALARETRQKVERLGLVTYTHVAKTADGDRTRVRVGPVPTRQEADKIATRIRAAGLPAAILTL